MPFKLPQALATAGDRELSEVLLFVQNSWVYILLSAIEATGNHNERLRVGSQFPGRLKGGGCNRSPQLGSPPFQIYALHPFKTP